MKAVRIETKAVVPALDAPLRQKEIANLLLVERRCTVGQLRRHFKVSEVTIRKDLAALEGRGALLRTHGGAVLAERPELVIPHLARAAENQAGKERMAQVAAKRVRDGEHILLDAGSSTLALARALRGRDVTVVTNSVSIAMEMAACDDGKTRVIVLGGSLRRSSLAMMGPLAQQQLSALHCDGAFLGASGYELRTGFCCQNLIEAETKRAMAAASRRLFLLADHTKFGHTAFAPFCPLNEVDALITDAAPPKYVVEALKKAGAELVVAG